MGTEHIESYQTGEEKGTNWISICGFPSLSLLSSMLSSGRDSLDERGGIDGGGEEEDMIPAASSLSDVPPLKEIWNCPKLCLCSDGSGNNG